MKKKPVSNVTAFKALIKRYETITLEEIKNAENACCDDIKESLTGFGYSSSCTLCQAVGKSGARQTRCEQCLYCIVNNNGLSFPHSYDCLDGRSRRTYDRIDEAGTAESLLEAYRERAEYMKIILKEFNERFK